MQMDRGTGKRASRLAIAHRFKRTSISAYIHISLARRMRAAGWKGQIRLAARPHLGNHVDESMIAEVAATVQVMYCTCTIAF